MHLGGNREELRQCTKCRKCCTINGRNEGGEQGQRHLDDVLEGEEQRDARAARQDRAHQVLQEGRVHRLHEEPKQALPPAAAGWSEAPCRLLAQCSSSLDALWASGGPVLLPA